MTPTIALLLALSAGGNPVEVGVAKPLDTTKSPSLQDCPCVTVQPFQTLPQSKTLEKCRSSDSATKPCTKLTHEFQEPAQFPFPRWGDNGREQDREGVLIYEGVTLSWDPETGTYDVAFTATIPDLPVWLRLQFTVKKDGVERTITLPPIKLEASRDSKPGDPVATTFAVGHRGFSSALKTGNVTISRSGSARFGTPLLTEESDR